MRTTVGFLGLSVLVVLLTVLFCGCRVHSDGPTVHTLQLNSEPLTLDRSYTSMVGPTREQTTTLSGGKKELLWLVGYEAKLVSSKTGDAIPDRFMCHVSVDLQKEPYQQRLGPRVDAAYRLITLSQGVTKVDFPPGFGMPIPSDQLLWVRSQLLNLNDEEVAEQIRFDIKLHYVRDDELKSPLKPLFLVRAPVVKAVDPEQNHFGGVDSSAGCAVGVNANPENYLEYDSQGQAFIPHWKVPPGREETKTLITERLALPDDLRVHTIVTHVHPSAESVTLVDLTTMEMIYQAQTTTSGEKLALDEISTYSSEEGVLLKKDHEYGLISVYDNKTDHDLDSMAVMYIYLHDPEYIPPTSAELSTPLPPETSLVKRDKERVEWESGSNYTLTKAFLQASPGWQLVSEAKASSEWSGPSGKLRLVQTASGCNLSLIL